MASQGKSMKRMESKKSYSWWWDSHISPTNSNWLSENLEEMDRSVKRMLKLIEEDADSFAKKAEVYFEKRPQLVAHVEEFYRMYRSLAERYDNVTGELQNSMITESQTQSSGISEHSSDIPSPKHRRGQRRSGPRAAGFAVFLGSGGGSRDMHQEGDESSSLTDSESESDTSSINNDTSLLGDDSDPAVNKKILELEFKLREAREKLQVRQNEKNRDLLPRIVDYEQQLRIANERIRYSDEEIARLRFEVQNLRPEYIEGTLDSDINLGQEIPCVNGRSVEEKSDPDNTFSEVMEALKSTEEKLQHSEKEIAYLRREVEDNKNGSSEKLCQLQDELELANKEITALKTKLNEEKRDASKLQENVTMLESVISNRDREIRDLKISVSDAEQKIFPEKAQIKAELSKLLEQQAFFQEQVKDRESDGCSLEEEIQKIKAEKAELKERLEGEIKKLKADIAERGEEIEFLTKSLAEKREEIETFAILLAERGEEIETLRESLDERGEEIEFLTKSLGEKREEIETFAILLAERGEEIETLRESLDERGEETEFLTKSLAEKQEEIEVLIENLYASRVEKNELNVKNQKLESEVSSKDCKITEMNMHLHQLHLELAVLIAGAEVSRRLVEELKSKAEKLEEEVERQRVLVLQGAEEKREAIRQLCFSIEHYRNGYQRLRRAFIGHRQVQVLAS